LSREVFSLKQTTFEMQQHLQRGATELATCWRITRNDGSLWGYTSHDVSLNVAGLVYNPQSGFSTSAVETKEGLSVDNLELDALVLSVEFNEAELMAGRWDFARVEIFQVMWSNPNAGLLILRRGTLGEVSFTAQGPRNSTTGTYKAELRGLLQPISQVIGEVVSQLCRANLGDARCKVDLPSLSVAVAVASVNAANQTISSPAIAQPAGYFSYGRVQFTSGANEGYSMEVFSSMPGSVTLFSSMPYPVAVGDTFVLSPGCDRRFSTCRTRFNNGVNFRGEPFLPGQDKLLQSAR
jgi:uncharacterized phage protein (TIGR02218 family)